MGTRVAEESWSLNPGKIMFNWTSCPNQAFCFVDSGIRWIIGEGWWRKADCAPQVGVRWRSCSLAWLLDAWPIPPKPDGLWPFCTATLFAPWPVIPPIELVIGLYPKLNLIIMLCIHDTSTPITLISTITNTAVHVTCMKILLDLVSRKAAVVPMGGLLASMFQLAVAKEVPWEEFKDPKWCVSSLPNETYVLGFWLLCKGRAREACSIPPWGGTPSKFSESADAGHWAETVPVLTVVALCSCVLMTAWTTSGNIRCTVVSICSCNKSSWPSSCYCCCCCCCCSSSLSGPSIWLEPGWLLGSKQRSSEALIMVVLQALIPLGWQDFVGSLLVSLGSAPNTS